MTLCSKTAGLFTHLHRGGNYSYVWTPDTGEFYTDKATGEQREAKRSLWFPAAARIIVPASWNRRNVYFGVHPTTEQRRPWQRSTLDSIAVINCLFGEYDAKDFDGGKAEALSVIKALDVQPSTIIDSGGGYHCYWLLADPITVDDGNREYIRFIQRSWVEFVGSDNESKDLCRVLRVPGFANRKDVYAPDFPMVDFVYTDLECLYDFYALCRWLPKYHPPTQRERVHIDVSNAKVGAYAKSALQREVDGVAASGDGNRNANLNKAAYSLGQLVGEQVIAESIVVEELTRAALSTGLKQGEISSTIKSGLNRGKEKGRALPASLNGTQPSRNVANGNHNMDNYHVDAPPPEFDKIYMPPVGEDCVDDYVMVPEMARGENASSSHHAPNVLSVDEIIEKIKASDWEYVQDNLFESISRLDSAAQRKVQRTLQVEYSGLVTKTDINSFLTDCRRFEKERKMAEKTERAEQRLAELTSPAAASTLRIIENNRDHNDVVDDALAALLSENQKNMSYPVAYVRGGLLTRVNKDESNITLTQEYKEPGLSYVLAKAAKWLKVGMDADGMITERSVTPPSYVVKTVLDMPEYADFPPLAGITNAPTFGAKGRLHDSPGYDIETKLFYANGINIGDTEPTTDNVTQALHMLRVELLGDFPFKDAASSAHALALTLLPFVRPMIAGPTPLHLIDSPTPGTGKGLLVEACSIPGTGGNMPATQAGRDPEEWRKRITSCLLTGASHISIDNISEALDSGELASALTQPIWSDRMLGANKEVRIPIRTIWVANGNNVVPSEEIARRIIWIRLDANAEQPWERDGFRHDNLISWAKEHRAELVTTCVTLVRAWVDKGMPAFGGKRKGSFENWSEILGGILEAVGVEGFLANDKELFETTSNEATMLTAFVEKWWELYGDTPVKTSDLFRLASFTDDHVVPGERWYGLLEDLLGSGRERSRQSRLGVLLRTHRDKVVCDLKITKGPILKGLQRWALIDVSNS